MGPLQLALDTSFEPVEQIVDAIERAIDDIRTVKDTKRPVLIHSGVVPLHDFQDDNGNDVPVYIPQQATRFDLAPLHFAAYCGKYDVVKLLSTFSDVKIHPENETATPIFLSLLNGHLSTANLLLELGASPNGVSCANGLHAAARRGLLVEILRFIRHYHMEPDVEDAFGATPAVYALYLPETKAIETISLLFSLGADPKVYIGDYLWTYAVLARAMGKEALASWLEIEAWEA